MGPGPAGTGSEPAKPGMEPGRTRLETLWLQHGPGKPGKITVIFFRSKREEPENRPEGGTTCFGFQRSASMYVDRASTFCCGEVGILFRTPAFAQLGGVFKDQYAAHAC